jgi:hypothetical protein
MMRTAKSLAAVPAGIAGVILPAVSLATCAPAPTKLMELADEAAARKAGGFALDEAALRKAICASAACDASRASPSRGAASQRHRRPGALLRVVRVTFITGP